MDEKGKGKIVPVLFFLTEHNAMKVYWEWRYISMHSWPRHFTELSDQLHAPAALYFIFVSYSKIDDIRLHTCSEGESPIFFG